MLLYLYLLFEIALNEGIDREKMKCIMVVISCRNGRKLKLEKANPTRQNHKKLSQIKQSELESTTH